MLPRCLANMPKPLSLLCPTFATGLVLNNQMDDFSSPGTANQYGLAPAPANYIRPGKRPLSSMSPLVVEQVPGEVGCRSKDVSCCGIIVQLAKQKNTCRCGLEAAAT